MPYLKKKKNKKIKNSKKKNTLFLLQKKHDLKETFFHVTSCSTHEYLSIHVSFS